jgi:hypothetical protein
MTHYYYIKIPTTGSEDVEVAISNYVHTINHGFPPEPAVLFAEVFDSNSASERFKNLYASFQSGDLLEVPEASMITTDVEEFVKIQSQLLHVGVKLEITGS